MARERALYSVSKWLWPNSTDAGRKRGRSQFRYRDFRQHQLFTDRVTTWSRSSCSSTIGNGAKDSESSVWHGSALSEASANGHAEVVQVLLERRGKRTLPDTLADEMLGIASQRGHKEVARKLLDYGADPNTAQGGLFGNALYGASVSNHKSVVEILFDRGADINAKSGFYATALQAASSGGYEEVV